MRSRRTILGHAPPPLHMQGLVISICFQDATLSLDCLLLPCELETCRPTLNSFSIGFSRVQIMAGVDQEFQGESRLSDWAKVGYLEQEPKLDDGPTVSSNIEAAVVPTRTLLKEYEQVRFKISTPLKEDRQVKR